MAKPKGKKAWKILGEAVLGLLLFLLALSTVFSLVDRYSAYSFAPMGFRAAVISSGSMSEVDPANEGDLKEHSDRYQRGDVVFAMVPGSLEEYKSYDVVLYVMGDGTLVCHRLLSIDLDAGVAVTRGDANAALDAAVPVDSLKGIVRGKIPYVGQVIFFLQSPYGLLGISGCVFFVAAGCLIYLGLKKKGGGEGEEAADGSSQTDAK